MRDSVGGAAGWVREQTVLETQAVWHEGPDGTDSTQ